MVRSISLRLAGVAAAASLLALSTGTALAAGCFSNCFVNQNATVKAKSKVNFTQTQVTVTGNISGTSQTKTGGGPANQTAVTGQNAQASTTSNTVITSGNIVTVIQD